MRARTIPDRPGPFGVGAHLDAYAGASLGHRGAPTRDTGAATHPGHRGGDTPYDTAQGLCQCRMGSY